MAYAVRIAGPALRDAAEYHAFILGQSHFREPADEWFRGLLEAIYSLEQFPERCSVIPEQHNFRRQFRHLLYASHRIIFEITGQVVTVHRVYHSASRPLTSLRQRSQPPNQR